ncbi:glycosyl transferase [Methylopila jiangsuensis]|uniref:Glycosyl transferase n=1 Tax=Methylopila jiangsuensis TaxID=586230 RepID=A0A9W6JGV2_9HYPH|nr:glycosyltransferase [Methylopila jiangsuensis]MDR6286675.1 glycosyltransferase involved in cell wall biosynthesis [Methylopila jiangsuensis]GLK76982.1 glycosyl transferase [Methylopila jiangsuensis]
MSAHPLAGRTILQILPALDAGGVERTAIDVAAALVRAGARALVLSEGGRGVAELEAAGAEHRPFPAATKNPLQMARNVGRLAALIEAEAVALVHARSRAPAWSALAAARRTGRPLVTTAAGIHRSGSAPKRFYNSVMARGDLVIANSAFTAAHLASEHGDLGARVTVIPRGVDLARFDPAAVTPERVAALRAAWDAGPDARIVLLAARLTRWKGQSLLLKAIARLNRPDVLVVLAGDPQGRDRYREELQSEAETLGLSARVRMPGHVADVPAALAAAAVAVVPSIEPEAFGRGAAEAQAMGVPVVAAAHGAPAETVLAPPACPDGDRTGWLVHPGDEAALAEGLAAALAMSATEREALGRRARTRAVTRFGLDAMTDATLDAYSRLLAGWNR